MTSPTDPATVDSCLKKLGGGLGPSDREHVVDLWSRLDQRMKSFRADEVELRLTVKERDQPSQHTTLEAHIARRATIVATSNEVDLDRALTEVRDDLIRQLTDAKNRTEPRQNRKLRG
jgi:ribosome-associated translation inhibitor RaiA